MPILSIAVNESGTLDVHEAVTPRALGTRQAAMHRGNDLFDDDAQPQASPMGATPISRQQQPPWPQDPALSAAAANGRTWTR